jgi:hypothetical protein
MGFKASEENVRKNNGVNNPAISVTFLKDLRNFYDPSAKKRRDFRTPQQQAEREARIQKLAKLREEREPLGISLFDE